MASVIDGRIPVSARPTWRGRAAVARTPVWFMRQAGRSLPEYRAVRGDGSILEAIKQPQLAAEITIQPVRRYGVDAAVLFSTSSSRSTPSASASTSPRAPDRSPRNRCAGRGPAPPPSAAARRHRLRRGGRCPGSGELGAATPVLAFAGAPFTVASYLVEGRPSRTYEHTKALYTPIHPTWHELMDTLAAMAVEFVDVQLTAGAGAFQLFDSWAGTLSAASYERFVLPTPGVCSPSWPTATRASPASTSASAATTCSSRWPPPGSQRDRDSTGGRPSSPRASASATTSPSRATSTRRSCSPAPRSPSAVPRVPRWGFYQVPGVLAAIVQHVHGAHLQPRPRRPPASDPAVLARPSSTTSTRRARWTALRSDERPASERQERPAWPGNNKGVVVMAYGTPRP